MTTLVQKYLETHSLEDLERDHGVKVRVAGHKLSLNYNQLEAKDSDELAQACRGLILAPMNGITVHLDRPLGQTRILARPFDRFFNFGQEAAANVDLNHPDTRFYEKLDGTLAILYFDDIKGEWCVATRAVADADLPIDGFGEYTFRTLFEHALKDTAGLSFETFTQKLDPNLTYCFELTTPLNRIVVDYSEYRITLLGVRNRETGREIDPLAIAKSIDVPHAQVYRFGSIDEMTNFVHDCNPQEHEGIVVCDPQFRRVKIKNAGYLALNRVRDSVLNSPRGLVELILLEKLDDALPLFPEYIVERAEKLREGFRKLISDYRGMWSACKAQADTEVPLFNPHSPALAREHRKAFALAVQEHHGWIAPLMEQYQGRCTDLADWIHKKRTGTGGWSNGFLDKILKELECRS